MGIDLTALRTLFMVKRLNLVDFSMTVTLGRHEIFFSKEEYEYVKNHTNIAIAYNESFYPSSFQENLLIALGAINVESIDASKYEGASIIHNFNERIPIDLYRKYTLFLDFGSIEHIFDVRQVIRNIGLLLKVGGHSIILTDANGNSGHGLYQFSPEFFYSAFSNENGFSDTVVLLIDPGNSKNWLLVKPPTLVQGRVEAPVGTRYLVLCLSRKSASVDKVVVEQSDYFDAAWHQSNHQHAKLITRSKFQLAVRSIFRSVNIFGYNWLQSILYSINRKVSFKSVSYPFIPESAPQSPYDKLTSIWG